MQKQDTVPGCKYILGIRGRLPVRTGRLLPFLAQFGGRTVVIFLTELIQVSDIRKTALNTYGEHFFIRILEKTAGILKTFQIQIFLKGQV